jgi:hypothetical protein
MNGIEVSLRVVQSNDFTKADFPRPIWPNTTMLGLVSLPLA